MVRGWWYVVKIRDQLTKIATFTEIAASESCRFFAESTPLSDVLLIHPIVTGNVMLFSHARTKMAGESRRRGLVSERRVSLGSQTTKYSHAPMGDFAQARTR